jgi:hypothetical protein
MYTWSTLITILIVLELHCSNETSTVNTNRCSCMIYFKLMDPTSVIFSSEIKAVQSTYDLFDVHIILFDSISATRATIKFFPVLLQTQKWNLYVIFGALGFYIYHSYLSNHSFIDHLRLVWWPRSTI